MDDKTKLSYWLGQTGGRTNAAYTLQKEYNHALQGRGPGPRTLKKDMVSTTSSTPSISTPTGYQYSPDTYVDTPRGYQYSPDTYKAPAASQTQPRSLGQNPGYGGGKMDWKVTAGIVGGLAAVPVAIAAAPIAAGAVAASPAVAAALGTAGAIGTKIVSNVSKVGTRVSSVLPATKASKLAADTAAKKTADRVAGAAARKKAAAAAAKKKAAAADKAQKGETAAMTNYAGALGQQDARMGGSGARR